MELKMQIFTFLFLMLGPFKIIGPFAQITMHADPKLTRQIAFRAIFFSILALLTAALLGQTILSKYGIPLPILSLSAGIILFLVALLNIIQQFTPTEIRSAEALPPTMNMAINPLAFPTIVTPYGIAAVIVFLSISPDMDTKMAVGAIVVGIMALNLVVMLITRYIYKVLAVILPILGAVLGVVQVALGLMIMFNALQKLLNT